LFIELTCIVWHVAVDQPNDPVLKRVDVPVQAGAHAPARLHTVPRGARRRYVSVGRTTFEHHHDVIEDIRPES
jgi:hypothetical protein